MIKVDLPNNDDVLENLYETLSVLSKMSIEFRETKTISLDFSEVEWVIPCSIILISNKIMSMLDKGATSVTYRPSKISSVRKYMEAIGFPLGVQEDGNSFVSIKHFSNNPKDKNQINTKMNELLNSIQEKIPAEFGSSVMYILGELSDNIDNHSKFKSASLMAQFFPKKRKIDIAVFDDGITIPGSYEESKIIFESDTDAIKKAVFEGISTKKDEEFRGYGLRTCRKLSTKGLDGELHIISRKGILLIKPKEDPKFYDLEENPLDGTFLYIRLDQPSEKIDIHKYVDR